MSSLSKLIPRKSKIGRKYGWIVQLPDIRDRKYIRRILPETLSWDEHFKNLLVKKKESSNGLDITSSSEIDIRPQCPPIVDQGNSSSCTSNSLAGALGFLEIKDGLSDNPFSRLFIYFNERIIEGTTSSDSGAMIRDGIKTLASNGACYESTWPFDLSKITVQPPPEAYTEGGEHLILTYEALQNIDDMKDCLASGYPFVFGFTVYESFESDEVARTGIVPMPRYNESVIGGHAVVCVGFSDKNQWFIVRNSWGQSWGDNGTFYLPYEYMSNPNLTSDYWCIRRGEDMLHERPDI